MWIVDILLNSFRQTRHHSPEAILLSCAAGPSARTFFTCRNSSGRSPPMMVKPKPWWLFLRAVWYSSPFSWVGSRVNPGVPAAPPTETEGEEDTDRRHLWWLHIKYAQRQNCKQLDIDTVDLQYIQASTAPQCSLINMFSKCMTDSSVMCEVTKADCPNIINQSTLWDTFCDYYTK